MISDVVPDGNGRKPSEPGQFRLILANSVSIVFNFSFLCGSLLPIRAGIPKRTTLQQNLNSQRMPFLWSCRTAAGFSHAADHKTQRGERRKQRLRLA